MPADEDDAQLAAELRIIIGEFGDDIVKSLIARARREDADPVPETEPAVVFKNARAALNPKLP